MVLAGKGRREMVERFEKRGVKMPQKKKFRKQGWREA